MSIDHDRNDSEIVAAIASWNARAGALPNDQVWELARHLSSAGALMPTAIQALLESCHDGLDKILAERRP